MIFVSFNIYGCLATAIFTF